MNHLPRAGLKLTTLRPLPEDWEVKPLHLISPKQSVGLVVNPSSYFSAIGTVPMLVGSNILEDRIDAKSANRITEESNRLIPASRVFGGDLLTVRVGEPGLTAVVPPELHGCNCASVMIVRRHDSFNSHWLSAAMNSRVGLSQVENVQYGTAQKQFNISDAVNFVFPVPPVREQDAIAEALSDTDALIESLEQLLVKKRQIKQGAMRELLSGQRRLPGFAGEWLTKRLADIAHIKTGDRNNQDKNANGHYPFFVRSATVERIDSYSHDCEAILIPGEGGIGSIFHYVNGRFDVHQRVYAITEFQSGICAKYVYLYMSVKFGAHAMQNSVKATVDSLRLPTFQEFVVSLPSNEREQSAIATTLSDMDAELTALEARLAKTRLLKQGMAQALLTGRIRLV